MITATRMSLKMRSRQLRSPSRHNNIWVKGHRTSRYRRWKRKRTPLSRDNPMGARKRLRRRVRCGWK